jgi:hypothetical protein
MLCAFLFHPLSIEIDVLCSLGHVTFRTLLHSAVVYKSQLSVSVYPEGHKFEITAPEVTSLMVRMILTIIISQKYWDFGLLPSSGILGNRKHDVSENGCISVLR